MDETKTTRNTEFNSWLDLPETFTGPIKYPIEQNIKNNELIRIN